MATGASVSSMRVNSTAGQQKHGSSDGGLEFLALAKAKAEAHEKARLQSEKEEREREEQERRKQEQEDMINRRRNTIADYGGPTSAPTNSVDSPNRLHLSGTSQSSLDPSRCVVVAWLLFQLPNLLDCAP